ncbi:hypothetical protein FBEOM_5409 [Fusarium beomiforme]|uniref:Uncharacterized protein n=1 Tax=Fusarium beomiforme TaxID=44412 RepID=A0A9P5E014_9HYPO|nr:hypothetical protein FBEOM_5409 [Fusarium beomiforme]
MQTRTLLTSLLTILPATGAFKFTGPDPSKPLDVSKEITITWTGGIPKTLSPKFDFTWFCQPDKLNAIGSDVTRYVDDVYLSDGEYKFQMGFRNAGKMLIPFADKLAANASFSFQAVFTDWRFEEVLYWSDNYTVVGIPRGPKGEGADSEVEL